MSQGKLTVASCCKPSSGYVMTFGFERKDWQGARKDSHVVFGSNFFSQTCLFLGIYCSIYSITPTYSCFAKLPADATWVFHVFQVSFPLYCIIPNTNYTCRGVKIFNVLDSVREQLQLKYILWQLVLIPHYPCFTSKTSLTN